MIINHTPIMTVRYKYSFVCLTLTLLQLAATIMNNLSFKRLCGKDGQIEPRIIYKLRYQFHYHELIS